MALVLGSSSVNGIPCMIRSARSRYPNTPWIINGQVVITGVGAVSPLGWGDDFWNGLIEGRSGITRLPSWADEYPAKVRLFCLHLVMDGWMLLGRPAGCILD